MQRLKAWIPAIVWMSVIFMMSAMPGEISGEQSGTIVQLFLWVFSIFFGPEAAAGLSINTVNLLIRKCAHMTEYAVLFLCYHRALKCEGAKHPGLSALLLCTCYAATDEWHQSFTEGRGPSIIDVGIDALGAAVMWGMMSIKKRAVPAPASELLNKNE